MIPNVWNYSDLRRHWNALDRFILDCSFLDRTLSDFGQFESFYRTRLSYRAFEASLRRSKLDRPAWNMAVHFQLLRIFTWPITTAISVSFNTLFRWISEKSVLLYFWKILSYFDSIFTYQEYISCSLNIARPIVDVDVACHRVDRDRNVVLCTSRLDLSPDENI